MGKCFNNSCGHEHNHLKKIYLTLTDNSQLECDVLDIFEYDGNEYIAVLPIDSETALLYRFNEVNGELTLSNIESDDEYERASEAFMKNYNHDHDHCKDHYHS